VPKCQRDTASENKCCAQLNRRATMEGAAMTSIDWAKVRDDFDSRK
jgi:hypothetical protein